MLLKLSVRSAGREFHVTLLRKLGMHSHWDPR